MYKAWILILFFPLCLMLMVRSEDHINLLEAVKKTYPKIIECLKDKTGVNIDKIMKLSLLPLPLPLDALEAHYKEIFELTLPFRGHNPHNWAGFAGPWIENIFISHFIDKPLSYFNGMIPLFVQWTDIHVNAFAGRNQSLPIYSQMTNRISQLLRDDVIYFTVVQDDEGLTSRLADLKPNILSFSAGGYGHIPIPLVKGELEYSSPHTFSHDVSFLGTTRHGAARTSMLAQIERCANERLMNYEVGSSQLWKKVIEVTRFNLAPRGYGRTSYRLTEIIQIGRIPVYMYDDNEWLPYGESNISAKYFGFSTKFDASESSICDLVQSFKNMTSSAFTERLDLVKAAREHYTYAGVIRQMELFFQDPLGPTGGELRCVRVPDNDHRRRKRRRLI